MVRSKKTSDQHSPDARRREVLRLLLEHRSMLFAFVLSIARDFDRAEDVFQDVSVVVCERYAQFVPGTDFGAWVREIARRRIWSRSRSEGKLPLALPAESLDHVEAAFVRLQPGEPEMRMKALRACLGGVAASVRRLLALRYAQGLGLERIAREEHRKPDGIRKALYRTRQTLRACIERRLRLQEERT